MNLRHALSGLILSGSLAACTASATGAAEANAADGSIIRAGCRQGECSWLRVVRQESLHKAPQGELRRLVARRGSSVHLDGSIPEEPPADIGWEAAEGTYHAFCSTERPAYAFPGEEGMTVHFLDLFDLPGYQMASAGMYLRLCHRIDALPEDEKVLRGLGYRPGTRSEQVEAAGVETMTRF
jgi:hypothetical protein